jgi:hypothetical protein
MVPSSSSVSDITNIDCAFNSGLNIGSSRRCVCARRRGHHSSRCQEAFLWLQASRKI